MKRLILFLALLFAIPVMAQRVFYISRSGSDSNNGTSTSTPWQTHPYMNHGGSCTTSGPSSGPTYSHQAGDIFIFKGGDTWGIACFTMTIQNSGTASAIDYFGACGGQTTAPSACGGATWPTTGWTRPLFDLQQQTPGGNWVIAQPFNVQLSYLTFDDIEIANQNIYIGPSPGGFQPGCAMLFSTTNPLFAHATGISAYNMYIHDWVSTSSVPVSGGSNSGYCFGGISGVTLVDHLTMHDANGWGTINGARVNGPWGGGVEWEQTLQNSVIHDVSTVTEFQSQFNGDNIFVHDNEVYNASQSQMYDCIASTAGYPGCINNGATGLHSDGVYDNQTQTNYCCTYVYNNYIHDTYGVGVSVSLNNGYFYNNVLTNNHQQLMGSAVNGGSPVNSMNIFNNIIDCSVNSGAYSCIRAICATPYGTNTGYHVNLKNNLFILANGQGPIQQDGVCTVAETTDYPMPTSEAITYGFCPGTGCGVANTNKYYPSNPNDPKVKSAGTNLSPCSGNLAALCQDTQGAPWYGGSYQPRGSTWDLGSYVLGGGGGGSQQFSCNISSITTWPSSANQPINIASAQVVATCSNPGTLPTTINSMVISGANPSDFTFSTAPSGGTCGGSLAAGGTCTVSFVFTPSAVGNRAATWTATTNATPSTTTISLSGIGSYYVQQCANYQNPPITSLSCTWPAPQVGKMVICWLYLYDTSGVTFNTPTDGVNTFMAANAPITQVGNGIIQAYNAFSIGNGTAPTITATLSSSSSHHGGISCGEYVSFNGLDTTVFATGTSTSPNSTNLTTATPSEQLVAMVLPFTATASPGAGYTQRTDPNILFEDQVAGAAGAYNATASLSASDPWIIQLMAFRSSAPIASLSPSSLNYGNQLTHTTSAVQYAVLNSLGTAPLNVTNITVIGQYTLSGLGSGGSNCPGTAFTLPVGNTCNIGVVFSPSSAGAAVGTLSVSDNANTSPQSTSLSGTGITPVISWNPTSYAFGSVQQGQTSTSSNIVLSNTGTGQLNVRLTVSDQINFSVASTSCSSTLGAGNSCNVVAQCNPQSAGNFSANLTETDSLQSISASVALTCTGLPLPPAFYAPAPVFTW
jgi:hypothetical protein